MLSVNNKILWLADFDLDMSMGGAQRSDKILIDQGKLLGYNIVKLNKVTFDNSIDINKFDVLITANLAALTHQYPDLIDKISKHKYHVRLEHDSNEYLKQEDRMKLFGSCVKSIFLSDFHISFFKARYGDIFKNIEIIYDPIDFHNFKNLNLERENKILYSGYMHPLKGSYDFFDFALNNPQQKFVVTGWTSHATINHLCQSIENVEYLGQMPYEKMPEIYNRYSMMFYEPNLNEPFCRSVAEAVLCGMKIIISEQKQKQIGCLHEIEKIGIDNFREKCSKASLKFWQSI
jgi:glycosyltransferase involved in cell wall biosynthesis